MDTSILMPIKLNWKKILPKVLRHDDGLIPNLDSEYTEPSYGTNET